MMSLSVHKCDGAADPSMKGYSLVLDGRMCPNHGCCGRRPLCAKTGVLLLLAISCVESFPTKPLTQPRFRGPKGSREQRRQRWAMQMAVDNSSNDADAKIDDDTELPTPKGSPKTRKICLDYPSDESDGLGLAPKRMCVDYPSFAYDQSEKNRRIKKVIYRAVPTNPNEQGNAENNSDRTNQATTTLRNLDFTGMDDDGNSISVPFWKRFTSSSGFEWDLRELTNSAKRTRLVSSRSYAKKEAFNDDTMTKPPKLSDLSPPFSSRSQKLGISTPARIASFGAAYLAFPYIVSFLNRFVTMQPEELDQITSRFSPGISILYGTFVSLTLSILYRRQQDIQDHVATESSMLVFTIRGLLSLFHKDPPLAVEAGQCAADQLRTLVRSSRGAELMLLMYSDPYARMLELIDNYEDKLIQNDRAVGVKGVSHHTAALFVAPHRSNGSLFLFADHLVPCFVTIEEFGRHLPGCAQGFAQDSCQQVERGSARVASDAFPHTEWLDDAHLFGIQHFHPSCCREDWVGFERGLAALWTALYHLSHILRLCL